MERKGDAILNARGEGIEGLSVTIRTDPGGVLATIYSDNGVTTTPNPLTTDEDGEYQFFAANGRYQIVVSGLNIETQTITGVILDDPATVAAGSFTDLTVTGYARLGSLTPGNESMYVYSSAAAADRLEVTAGAGGAGPKLSSAGAGANVALRLLAKGASNILFFTDGAGTPRQQFAVMDIPNAVNYLAVGGSASTAGLSSPPTVVASGSDVDISIGLTPKGSGVVELYGGQLKFPATQNPSSNVNTLDDYEEFAWTPAFTCSFPGTLAITTVAAVGKGVKVGKDVTLTFDLQLSAFTIGTASGGVIVSGMPSALSPSGGNASGTLKYQGINKPGFSHIVADVAPASTLIALIGCPVDGTAASAVDITQISIASGGIFLNGSFKYIL